MTQIGLTFKIAANLDSDKIEFIAHESWIDGNEGVMSGAIDKTTGEVQFEKRDERINSTCGNSSCGWNRHTRIFANLTMVDGEPNELESFSYAMGDTQIEASNGGPFGKLITAKGSLNGEIKARLFNTNVTNAANLKVIGNYSEMTNTACDSGAGVDTSGDCSSESGIDLFTGNTKFMLYSTPDQVSPANWLSNFGGFNFSTVDINVDEAYN